MIMDIMVAYFLREIWEFVLVSVAKPFYKQNHEFETFLCQVRIVKSCEKQLKRKDDRI